MSKIVDYIKKKRPYLNVIIWDDMIRKNLKVWLKLNINEGWSAKILILRIFFNQ